MSFDLVSVVIPAYNAETYITSALESIFAQAYRPLEIIVVNDGSTDATAERVRAFGERVTLLEQENRGIFATLNRGIRAAQGEWLTFLDADDLWTAQRLETQLAAFDADATLEAVFGLLQNFYSPDTDETFRARVACPPEPLPGIWHHTLLLRRTMFLRVGYFAEDWQVGNFMEWFARATTQNLRYIVIPNVVLRRRLHPNNTGIREREAQQDYARILKHVIAQRRAAKGMEGTPPRSSAPNG